MIKKYLKWSFILLIILSSCNDQWDDHNSLNSTRLSKSLYELIGEDSDLSTFYNYIKQVGYDTLLKSSKSYTVWAPTNTALSGLADSIVSNDSLLKRFIGNHIAYNEYTTDQDADTVTMKMLNGKNIKYVSRSTTIEGSTITSSNEICQNGVLHTLSSAMNPRYNLWEYVSKISGYSLDSIKNIFSITEKVFDEDNSTRTGSNSAGEDVYDTVWAYQNLFLTDICDVSNEDSVYTFFVLTDDAFVNEYNKMSPYIADTTADSLALKNYYTRMNVCKDIVVRGKYTSYAAMPDSLTSIEGIKFPKSVLTIASSYESSNGMVYVVSAYDIPLDCKIPTIKIEGEDYYATYDGSFDATTVSLLGIRVRSWASGGKDLYIPGGQYGHRTYYLSVSYKTPVMYSIKYNVYWRAVNDGFYSSTFTQKIAINAQSISDIIATSTSDGDTLVCMKTIYKYVYSEVLLGVTTNHEYGTQRYYLASNSNYSASPYADYMVLDYLKLVPVFN